jgi:hypothetical protein
MNKYTFTDNDGKTHERISKAHARKIFTEGKPVIFCPSNLCPFGFWNPQIEITAKKWIEDASGDATKAWEAANDSFMFYNCVNTETGKYIAYYTA